MRRYQAGRAAPAVLARPGARLAYQVTGTGPAVVLVHGYGLDMRMWDAQLEALAARFRVVRYDCRGFGASGPFDPAVPYTHADDLIALLDHLAITDAALAGLSFGGRVVLQAALAAPDRVRGLALLGAVLDGVPWDPESADALDEVGRAVQASGLLAGRAAWLAHPLFATARERPDLARELTAMVAGYPGQHWLGQDPHRRAEPPPIDVLEDVTGQALVAVGEHDVPGFREMSAVLARRIPGAEYHLIPGAGHMINMEQPDTVNGLLTGFLAGLMAPAAGGQATAAQPGRRRCAVAAGGGVKSGCQCFGCQCCG
jgi:3-oxoadipate enol-lactonase